MEFNNNNCITVNLMLYGINFIKILEKCVKNII